jgi:hypothetical protein
MQQAVHRIDDLRFHDRRHILSLHNVPVIAEGVALHKGFRPDHLEIRVEALGAGVVIVAANSITDISSFGLSECCRP